jgi:hypothetical protein
MVCKIRSGKSIRGALNYNENKVNAGVAECIGAVNFIAAPKQLNFHDKLLRFEDLIEKNTRAKTNTVHISLNFDMSEKLNPNKLIDIASTYMNKIGFGDQPYLVYQHHDAAHPHLHIVTTNIQENGKRISIHNLGRNESEKARKEIETQYDLIKAESQPKRIDLAMPRIEKVVYGKTETKKCINKIVSGVTQFYKYTSLAEFNAILRQYNVVADRGKEGMRIYENNGLVYCILGDKGNKIGVPIKASALLGKPTLKTLRAQFKLNKILRQPHKEKITKVIDSFFHVAQRQTRKDFCDYMNLQEISAMFWENKDGRVYGLTLIDNKKGIVFNGSALGKGYSAQALIKRLEENKTCEMEKVELRSENHTEASYEQKPDWKAGIPGLIEDLIKTEKFYQEPLNLLLKKRTRKKKRGHSL